MCGQGYRVPQVAVTNDSHMKSLEIFEEKFQCMKRFVLKVFIMFIGHVHNLDVIGLFLTRTLKWKLEKYK
jgi:hypothetical protein